MEFNDPQNVTMAALTLAVPLCKLDFDLPATNPLAIQIVESVLSVTDIFECGQC